MTQRILLVLLLAGSLLAPSPVPAEAGTPWARESESAGPEGAGTITAGSLEAYLRFVASDEIRGRDTPSRGLDLVARYLASHLARWDVRPAGDDGSYFQEIVLERTTVDPGATTVTLDDRRFAHGTGFYAETLAVSVEDLLGQEPQPAKRGPTPKLQEQLEQLSELPRSKQRFVSEMLDTVLQQAS